MPGTTLLFDTIERYYRLLTSENPSERDALAALQGWFDSHDRSHPETFERLCEQYLIDPHAIRRMLRQRRRAVRRV